MIGWLAAFLLLGQIGSSHLSNFDDCFYAQRAKEMLAGGDWITPHWNFAPQVDNPPFFMWLITLSFAVFGVKGAAAILPSALAGVGSVVLTQRLAPRVGLDGFGAWASAFVLLTTGYFLKFSGHAMLDVLVTFLTLAAIHFYLDALERDRRCFVLAGLCIGLAVLTKSVVGLLPGIALALHLAWTRGPRRWLDPWFVAGAATALVVGGWWFAYEWATRPEIFVPKWRWMLFDRSFVIASESLPWWKYFDYLMGFAREYWPWLPVAAAGAWMTARRAWRGESGARLLVLWFVVVVGALSLANEKKLWYVMAVFPCLALWSATALASWIRGEPARRRVLVGGTAALFGAAVIVNLTPIKLSIERRPDLQRMAVAARTLVPAGERLVSYDIEYYSVTPQFLFYSDRTLSPPETTATAVRRRLDDGAWALLARTAYEEVARADTSRYPIVVSSGGWVLAHAAPRPEVRWEPREPYR